MRVIAIALAAALCGGCGTYSWRPAVPPEMRTVCVPTFRNDSSVTELGAAVSRQILREVQREGTFSAALPGDAAIEVQGTVKSAGSKTVAYERRTGARTREHRFDAVASVSFIDKRSGRVLVDGRRYSASTTFLANDDVLSGERDASGRIAEEIARQVVDDLLDLGAAKGAE